MWPDDSASVPALPSTDRLPHSSQSMAQLLSRCSLVVLFLSQVSRTAHFRKIGCSFDPRPVNPAKRRVFEECARRWSSDFVGRVSIIFSRYLFWIFLWRRMRSRESEPLSSY